MDGPIWTKFSGLSRLVKANLGVDSTSAQSPPCRTGPEYSPFPWSQSPQWLWGCYWVVSYHFRKH